VIAGVVLAAGHSSRLGRPKQLLAIHGEPLLRYTVRRILSSSLDEIFVVVGHEADAVRSAIDDLTVRSVFNPDFARGQSTSVRAGLKALSPETAAAVFLLGDQPGIDPDLIDALIAAWSASNAPVVAPRYTDGVGNPVLFDRRVFPNLLTLEGDQGAKPIVRDFQRKGLLETVAIPHASPPDVDTDADYAALLAAAKSPSPCAQGEGLG
jgi:molybdenum cofactor cytidylyltransferase